MVNSGDETVLVGGDALFREGVRRILEGTQFSIVNVRPSLDELDLDEAALDRLRLALLLDFPSDQPRFLSGLYKLRARCAGAHVVVLAADDDPDRLLAALDAGVRGYLPRHISREALVQSIFLIMLGETIFPTKSVMSLLNTSPSLPSSRAMPAALLEGRKFTKRDRDILTCLVEGKSNKLIAKRFGTTEATVKAQVGRLLNKIGVANRTQAAILALGLKDRCRW